MKFPILLSLVWLSGWTARGGTLYLLNGDRLHGAPLGLKGTRLLWRASGQEGPLKIPAAYVHGIEFDASTRSPDTRPPVQVKFANGDVFHADALRLTEKGLQVKGGEQTLTARVKMLRELNFQPQRGRVLMDGLDDPNAWTKSASASGAPSEEPLGYQDLMVRQRQFLSRKLPDVPDRFFIEVHAHTGEGPPTARLSLFAERASPTHHASLHYNFAATGITINQTFAGSNRQLLHEPFNWQRRMGSEISFYLYVDQKKREMYFHFPDLSILRRVEMDDVLRRQLAKDSWVHLTAFMGEVGLQQMLVAPWDGHLPKIPAPDIPEGKVRLELWGGPPRTGVLSALDAKRLILNLEDGTQKHVDLAEIRTVSFSQAGAIRAGLQLRDVRVVDGRHGHQLTFALMEMDETELRGESENWLHPFGLPVADLARLKFNVHSPLRTDKIPEGIRPGFLPHNPNSRPASRRP
ncbi:MAG: hypothetical protein JJU29_03940 [Verrucomicrobia bacterium]|nr:hypothetical protein [Verrucomicrobiota bacterium]MCH8512172.1 hypothetical protein [Kiritimatiellia bacterium]